MYGPFPGLETGYGELVFCCLRGRFFAWRFINFAGVDKRFSVDEVFVVYIGIKVIIRPKWQCIKSGVWALCLPRMYCFYGGKKS